MAAAAAVALGNAQEKSVLRQVEFYFSDSNLPVDNFLRKTVQESEDGLVSLALICSFTRMRTHLGLGNLKPEEVPEETVLAVAKSLRKSSALRVSEDGKRVGRSTELLKPEEVIKQVDSRTVAAAPLPYDVKLEDVETFFGQHGKVNSVRLPRHVTDKRQFCGTALVEFSAEEEAKKVLKETMVYAGIDLEIKPKKDFDSERESSREEADKACTSSDGSYPRGLILAFKLKNTSAEGLQEQKDTDKVTDGGDSKQEVSISAGDLKGDVEPQSGEDVDDSEKSSEDVEEGSGEKTAELQEESKGADDASEDSKVKAEEMKSLEGIDKKKLAANDKNVVTREDLKEIFQSFGTVKFVDFRIGEESGHIRFEDPEAAVKARATAVLGDEGGLSLKKCIVTVEALTGEAEKEYWSLLRGNQERFRGNKGGRGRGRGYRGGKQFNGKRNRQSDSADTGASKTQKV